MRFLPAVAALLALSGCSISQTVTPVPEREVAEICIKQNSAVLMNGFLPTMGSVLNSVCEPVVESVAQREPLGELYRQLCLGGMPFPRRAFPLGLDLA